MAPPIDWVANNSYVLSGLVGLGWLLAMLALEDQLRHVGEIAAVQRFVAWVTDNSMSIYLWHTLALVLAFYLVGVPNSPGQYIILAAVFAVLLASIVAAVRPLESLGSPRKGGFPEGARRADRAPDPRVGPRDTAVDALPPLGRGLRSADSVGPSVRRRWNDHRRGDRRDRGRRRLER